MGLYEITYKKYERDENGERVNERQLSTRIRGRNVWDAEEKFWLIFKPVPYFVGIEIISTQEVMECT